MGKKTKDVQTERQTKNKPLSPLDVWSVLEEYGVFQTKHPANTQAKKSIFLHNGNAFKSMNADDCSLVSIVLKERHLAFFSRMVYPASALADSRRSSGRPCPGPREMVLVELEAEEIRERTFSFCLFRLLAHLSMSFAICSKQEKQLIKETVHFRTDVYASAFCTTVHTATITYTFFF